MADEVEQAGAGINKMNVNDVNGAYVPVTYAYHVTNVKANDAKPDWTEMKWQLANDPYYDGLQLLGAPCVFFTTTLRDGQIPKTSMYPRHGINNEDYYAVKVPLTHFNDYHILYIHHQDAQVKLLLVTDEEFKMISDKGKEERERDAVQFLRRDATDPNNVQYYSNDYGSYYSRYFVCFAVCHNVTLGDDIEWFKVRHFYMPGCPSDEVLGKKLFENFAKLAWNTNEASAMVTYACHVTNEKVNGDEHPDWMELKWQLANDPSFDGPLLGAPCVLFTTTVCNNEIPTTSMFPRNGDKDEEYWAVKVPLTHFNDYHILHICNQDKLVRLLLVTDKEFQIISDERKEERQRDAVQYLRTDATDLNNVQYYSNDYGSNDSRYFVCFVVCHNITLGDDVEWFKVRHLKKSESDDEASRQKLFENFAKLVIFPKKPT